MDIIELKTILDDIQVRLYLSLQRYVGSSEEVMKLFVELRNHAIDSYLERVRKELYGHY